MLKCLSFSSHIVSFIFIELPEMSQINKLLHILMDSSVLLLLCHCYPRSLSVCTTFNTDCCNVLNIFSFLKKGCEMLLASLSGNQAWILSRFWGFVMSLCCNTRAVWKPLCNLLTEQLLTDNGTITKCKTAVFIQQQTIAAEDINQLNFPKQ